MKFLIVLLSLVALSSCKPNGGRCMFGPSYWCKNEETAKECGVLLFCKSMKTPSSKAEKIKFHPGALNKNKFRLDAPAVNVSFYYESLCPGCKEVWQDQLFPTFQKLGATGIVNFEFVPYGNAQEYQYGDHWQFTCQHGVTECTGNLIESCALHYYPDPNQHIPFLHCLEYYGPSATNGKYCASLSTMTYSQIDSCVNSAEGNALEHEMALKTESLNPPHQYVPWLTLNGRPSSALSSNMLATICNAYTGTKPSACGAKIMRRACYKGQ